MFKHYLNEIRPNFGILEYNKKYKSLKKFKKDLRLNLLHAGKSKQKKNDLSRKLQIVIQSEVINTYIEKYKIFYDSGELMKAYLGIIEFQDFLNSVNLPIISHVWAKFVNFENLVFKKLLHPIESNINNNNIHEAVEYCRYFLDKTNEYQEEQEIKDFPQKEIISRIYNFLTIFEITDKIALIDISRRLKINERKLLEFLFTLRDLLQRFKLHENSIWLIPGIDDRAIFEASNHSELCKKFPSFSKIISAISVIDLDLLAKSSKILRNEIVDSYFKKDPIFSKFKVNGNQLVRINIAKENSPNSENVQFNELISDLDKQFKDWEDFELERIGKVR